jgi:serine/threonine protein kinase
VAAHDDPTEDTVAARPNASPRERIAEGPIVAGRWRITRFIAVGGMGEVYEAEDVALGERVALKTVRRDAAYDSVAVERFKREVLLARKVSHPNVCRIFEFGVEREIVFLTMELLAGETLATRLRERGPMPLVEARAIAVQLCAALEAAHAAGVVHRDLKANNVMLVGERAVVTDFGLARAFSGEASDDTSLTGRGMLVGTPAYMAPEQIDGGPIGPATDIYALGVLLFELVSGRRPFEGGSGMEVAMRRLREDPPSLRALAPNVDAS